MGYLAFGPETQDIITFNLPQNWTTAAVKLSLCVGLFFTFSPMMIPVYQIVERGLAGKARRVYCYCYNHTPFTANVLMVS